MVARTSPEDLAVTTVRITKVEAWPGRQPGGGFVVNAFLVVLADEAGGRALPVWLRGPDGHGLWRLFGSADLPPWAPGASEELTVQLLTAAGVEVTGVDVHALDSAVTVLPPRPGPGTAPAPPPAAQVEFTSAQGSAGTMTARLGFALALAVGTGAPVRVSDAVLDQLAVSGAADDVVRQLLADAPPAPTAPEIEPRFEPRNLDFADGLAGWEFGGSFRQEAAQSHWRDYSCATDGNSAVLSSAVPEPYGFAGLVQTIFAERYGGRTAIFRGELRTQDVTNECGLHLLAGLPLGPVSTPDRLTAPLSGDHDWTRQEVTAVVPADAAIIQCGLFLRGRGRVELRHAGLTFDP